MHAALPDAAPADVVEKERSIMRPIGVTPSALFLIDVVQARPGIKPVRQPMRTPLLSRPMVFIASRMGAKHRAAREPRDDHTPSFVYPVLVGIKQRLAFTGAAAKRSRTNFRIRATTCSLPFS